MTDTNPTPDEQDSDNGEVRQPGEGPEATASGPEPQVPNDAEFVQAEGPDVETSMTDADLDFLSGQSTAEELAAERLADLQRVTAEYANYRKRTEATRAAEKERTTGDVVKLLLPVLDDLDRAAKHGDLDGDTPFATIAQKLRSSVERLGLRAFGVAGEAFDHNIHEAVFQQPTPDTTVSSVLDVVETGYYVGDTLLRAAKVVVAVPTE